MTFPANPSMYFKKKMNISPMQFRHSSHNQIDVGVFNIEGGK